MCVRCGDHETRDGELFCPICVIAIKVEVARGISQLGEYLRNWAAFQEWCAERGARAV